MKNKLSTIVFFATVFNLIFKTNGIILICNFQYNSPTYYYCQCNDFINTGSEELESIQGGHYENLTNNNVTYLQLTIMNPDSQNLTFTPQGIGKMLPNLKYFTFSARANKISADALNGLDQLEVFTSQNPIKYLPGTLFRNNPKLTQIQIMSPGYPNEGLESIGVNLLKNLRELRMVMFYGKCLMESASTPLQVLNLNQFLHVLCPSNEKVDFCPVSCLEDIEIVQRENDDLRSRVEQLERLIRE